MTLVAFYLTAVGTADLVAALGVTRSGMLRWLPASVGVLLLLALGALSAPSDASDWLLLVLAAALVLGWVLSSTAALGQLTRQPGRPVDPRLAVASIACLVGGLGLLIGFSATADFGGGPVTDWLGMLPVTGGRGLSPTAAALAVGGLLTQIATGNRVVRLVLSSVGALKPENPAAPQAADRLKGGRLLGPMERIVILGLGLAGQPTAASLVIAAKGLIRWPELSARARAGASSREPSIDEVTEYFLVGSFVSWLWALGILWLVHS